MVNAISFGWFAYFGKTLSIIYGRPSRFILTNGKHPKFLTLIVLYCLVVRDLWLAQNPLRSEFGYVCLSFELVFESKLVVFINKIECTQS